MLLSLNFFKYFFLIDQFQAYNKRGMRYRDFSHTSCPHTGMVSVIINITHQNGIIHFFLIKDESTLTHHNHPKSIVFISLALGVVYSVGLDRCIMTYIHHLSIIQITFTALKILRTLPLFLIIYCF